MLFLQSKRAQKVAEWACLQSTARCSASTQTTPSAQCHHVEADGGNEHGVQSKIGQETLCEYAACTSRGPNSVRVDFHEGRKYTPLKAPHGQRGWLGSSLCRVERTHQHAILLGHCRDVGIVDHTENQRACHVVQPRRLPAVVNTRSATFTVRGCTARAAGFVVAQEDVPPRLCRLPRRPPGPFQPHLVVFADHSRLHLRGPRADFLRRQKFCSTTRTRARCPCASFP